MTQQVEPGPTARLGRAVGTNGAVAGVVLVLPPGEQESARGPSALAQASVRALARELAGAGAAEGLVAHVVRYRGRGWNGGAARLAADAEWAVAETVRRYGDVPVCLAGVDMGGRAALRAAGAGAVNSVVALAPWLPGAVAAPDSADAADTADAEPVRQLAGRRVLIVHGTNDERANPDLSLRLAARAKKSNRDVCRFEVHSDGHGMRQHRAEVRALSVDFVLGSLFGRPYARPLADALAAPPPLGLRMPLAMGFGRG
ncbi:prolyl oligopeptidase family serine peptidase [Streptomyces sp. NPDC021093]|uniref:prolyl oligopeptidase family serine peptidase n=1 Tax=Streptomyces sp. NPDC021093 TaxID=3365112 RepID=UPI00379B45B6